MLLPELVGPRALAFPTQGPTFPKKPQRPPGICTERFQPRPASGSIPARQFCAGPGWGRRQSVLRPQGEWREGQEGRADPFPSRGPSSAALHASRHGARVGLAALGLTGVRGHSEAWTGDTGLHGRRGAGARRAWKARRTAGGRRSGGGAGLGPRRLRPPPGRAPWGQHAGGPTRLLAPAAPAGPRSCKRISTFFLCSSPAPEASVHPSA